MATLIVSFALMGIGLGGWAGLFIKQSENDLFIVCILGCWISLVLAFLKVTVMPLLGFSSLVLGTLFFFPGLYIARIFNIFESPRVYLFELSGAGLAILALSTVYFYSSSEYIILIILIFLSVLGLHAATIGTHRRMGWFVVFSLALILSGGLLMQQHLYNSFDLFNLAKNNKEAPREKSFSRKFYLIKSYDNLVSRVEVLLSPSNPKQWHFSISGHMVDEFNGLPVNADEDSRLVTGLIKNPRVHILGTGAQGIVKLAKTMTASQNIDGVEINPGVYQAMTKDFIDESGLAYKGIKIRLGNGIADLKTNAQQYDIITMMNMHSTPRSYFLGAPDFAHTREFYKIVFDHLSPQGYLMMEEFIGHMNKNFAIYREIITQYQTLRDLGYENPERHFFIYNFNSIYHLRDSSSLVLLGVLVQKRPLSVGDISKIKEWAALQKNFNAIDYLPGVNTGPYWRLFNAIKNNRLNIDYPGEDLSVLTNDRPFPASGRRYNFQLDNILIKVGGITLLLLILIGRHSMLGLQHQLLNLKFLFFQFSIGMAYMMIENILMNVYQREFISPSMAFIVTMATLLISSAIGGRFLSQKSDPWIIATLTVIALLLHQYFISSSQIVLSLHLRMVIIIALIGMSGFLMGFFFPRGLIDAKERGLGINTGHFFAFNCIAGAFAFVFSYYLFVRFGFLVTLSLAAMLYMMATILLAV